MIQQLPRSVVVPPVSQSSSCDSPSPTFYPRDIRIEDGKLFFEKRWFRRGQAVLVEVRAGEKFPAMISAIGQFLVDVTHLGFQGSHFENEKGI